MMCLNCGAENPADYLFCWCCRAAPGEKPAPDAATQIQVVDRIVEILKVEAKAAAAKKG